jgi:DNA polymerase-3 subunit epsilon
VSTQIPWWQGTAVAFDLETTGITVQKDRVVTIALVHLGDGAPRPERYLVDPGIEIPEAATAIHGITTERARAEGVEPAGALDATAGALALAMRAGHPVIGMNVSFDLSMLHFECLRHAIPTLTDRLGGQVGPVVDVYVLDKEVDTYRKGSRKLGALCEHYGVKHHGAHDSAYDALASAEIAAQIAQRYPRIAKMPLGQLHTAQVGWSRAQRVGLQQYFDRQRQEGEDRQVVELGWPLVDSTGGAS